MGRRRRRRLHARPSGSQPPETRATAAEPRSPAGHSNKRPSVTDSVPERDKRRKLENDDGEETQVEEQATTEEDRNGLEEIGSDQEGADEAKSDQSGSNGEGSGDQNGDGGGGGLSDGSGPVFGVGDSETSILVTCGRNEGRLYLSKLRVVVNERCRSKCIRTGNAWWTPNEFQFVSGRGAAKDWKRTVKHAGRCLKALLTNGTLSLASTPPRCLCDSCKSQGSGKTANESDETGRTINESGEDLSNGNLVQDTTNIRNKGIKRRRSIKRHIKGDARNQGDRSDEPVPFASRKRRKFRKNSKPEAHSDSTVSLSADIVFDCVTGSKAAAAEEEVVTVAKSSDASSPGGVAPVSEPPLIVKRKPGRPKKKPSVIVSKKPRDVARRGETEVKDTAKKNSISGHGMPLGGVSDGTSGRPDDATPSSELPQDSPAGQTRIIPGAENVLPEIYSTRLNDVAETTSPTPATKAPVSPEAPETVAETKERISKSDALAKDTPHSHGTTTDALATTHDVPTTTLTDQAIPHDVQTTTLDAKTTTHDVHATTHDIHTTTHDVHMTTVTVLSDTNALPSDKRTEEEDVNENSTYEAADPLPVCPSDRTPSGDPDAPDGIEADRKELEDEVIVGGDVKDDVKKRSSPVREDFTETSLVAAHNTAEPRMKSAYLNAVIAELKRKKISRETGVTSNATKDQHHQQRTRHPSSAQLLQPTTLHPTAASLIKAELSPESKSMSDALIRDVQSPSSGLTSSSSSSVSCVSNPSLAFAPSTIVDGKPPCLKPHQPDAGGKDVAPSSDLRSSSSSRRTDSRTSARGNLPMSDFPHDEAAFWRHLPSMVGTEGKAGGGGKPVFGGRVADMSSPLSISQLASICGLSQSQLASLPFPPPQFSLYPPYLFMGFPLQPLLPEFQSGSGSLPPSPAAATTTTGVHPNVQRPPSRPVPPSASSSSSAAAVAPPSQYQHQQQSRRRRSHHHHHCKSSSSVSGPPKDPLLRQPSPDHRANSFSALRKTDSMPTNHSAALFSELNRWRSSAPGLSNQQSTGRTTKSSASNKFNPTVNSVQERKLWRPAAAIASSAKEYSSAYESSIVPPRPSAHASTKECAVTCRSYGDSSLAAHAYRFDSAAPVDFTRGFRARARDEGERKYSSNTGREEYPCDDQGVLDLSKK